MNIKLRYSSQFKINFYLFLILFLIQFLFKDSNAKNFLSEIYNTDMVKQSTLIQTEKYLKNESTEYPFELNNDGELVKPERLLSDWIEIIMLGSLLVIGFPLNAFALTRLLHNWYIGQSKLYQTKVYILFKYNIKNIKKLFSKN